MDEKGVIDSCLVISEDKSDSLCPMFFGVSCAFFSLGVLSKTEVNDEKWSEIRNRLLQGSAHLLGLLVWRVQRVEADSRNGTIHHKLEIAQQEIEELKRMRSEDAKANEKVVGIFASQEQSWFSERKKLRQQIGALLNEFRVLQKKREEAISEFSDKLQEKDRLLQSKDNELKQEEQKTRELEEKLKEAGNVVEELRDNAKRKAQEHSSEVWKHKTAYIELVSSQRQLEAEMSRTLRQVESAKQELDLMLEQKEESVFMAQKLSVELINAQKELEQKDKILSAMLRKSKLDTTEKQMLLNEFKLSKTKKKQGEVETERRRAVPESRKEKQSLRSMLTKHLGSQFEVLTDGRAAHSKAKVSSQSGRSRPQATDFLLEYGQPEHQKELGIFSPFYDQYLQDERKELADVKLLEGWVQSEAEKYSTLVEQRHHVEINAFAEQLRLKDEKLEAFEWRFLSMELEIKRLKSHIEGLNHDLSQLSQENMKLEALLLDRQAEINSLKQQSVLQLDPQGCQTTKLNSCPSGLALGYQNIWSKVKIIKMKPEDKEQETMTPLDISQEAESRKENKPSMKSQPKEITQSYLCPEKKFKEERDDVFDPDPIQDEHVSPEETEIVEKSSSSQYLSNPASSPWKMDLHSLGVSYKIKRLKQQLLILERLTGKREICEDNEGDDNEKDGIREFHMLMSLLNKQVNRYQSLQGKTDELCKRMHENDLEANRGGSTTCRSKEATKTLEHFLEETFQVQRYIVATGQKLIEIQSKIDSGFLQSVEEFEASSRFDMKRFCNVVRTLFQEIQRGIEVRVARIIGDLEGTLARDGIIHLSK
ncbi:uncharacterized protein LOC127798347 isoform X2 [Diospyros lotus]|uniref:uncharacterized protein LOC127798347 isoform X2 n=1 Tax=Diospyros lotus TaxID=55363 RepID=UPI00225A4D2D|nr:uncharacterized protein LOC127798347 isoform X2 [Diospyros lotus]